MDAERVFWQGVVLNGPFHTAGADRGSALNELLRDDFGRGIGVEEAMANHLPFQLTGSPVVSFGSTFLRDQAFGSELQEPLTELKIAATAQAELLRGGLGADDPRVNKRSYVAPFPPLNSWAKASSTCSRSGPVADTTSLLP